MESVGAILDRLQSLFGKGYLVAGVFPLLVGLLFSAPLIVAIDPESPYQLADLLELTGERKAALGVGLVLLFCFVGFLLWLMNSSLRHLLESPPLDSLCIPFQMRRQQGLQQKLSDLRPNVLDLRLDQDNWRRRVATARNIARQRGTSGTNIDRRTQEAYASCRDARRNGKDMPADQIRGLCERLETEFQTNTAEAVPALHRVAEEFDGLVTYALTRAEATLNSITEQLITQFPAAEGGVAATDLANRGLASVDRFYGRYGINIDLLWPVLEKFGRADEALSGALEEAKLRLDFSVAMAAVWGILTMVWLPLLLLEHAHWAIFFSAALAGPLLFRLIYRMSVINSSSLYATMGAAMQLCRFELIKALHLELPPDSDAERQLWRTITEMAELGQGTLTYQHPA